MLKREPDTNRKKVRILVVDDEKMVREVVAQTLKSSGYEIVVAGDAEKTLVEMGNSSFELALLDIEMPGKSGIELLGEIVERYPDTAVVMVTGVDDIEVALTTVKMGAYDYITKPFTPSVLSSCAERALEKRRLIIENRNYQLNLERLVAERTQELERALGDIEVTYDATIKALGAALDLRDSETEDHSQRVAEYVLKLAKTIGIKDKKKLKDIEWGAFLHDIGKIGVPDAILRKPGKLTSEEMELVKTHPELGFRLLAQISFLQGAAELLLAHHECYDGSGYPMGLKGEDIPLSARLFAVADTVDAMTSNRPYRKALSLETVSKELRRLSGIQFDPSVVDVFFSIPEGEWGLREKKNGAKDIGC